MGRHPSICVSGANQADGTTRWSSSRSGRSAAMRRNASCTPGMPMEPNWSCAAHDAGRLAQPRPARCGRREEVGETGDTARFALYPESLRTERRFHDVHITASRTCAIFLDCVKSRAQPASMPTCAISTLPAMRRHCLDARPKVAFDLRKSIIGDDEANRMRRGPCASLGMYPCLRGLP